MNPFEKIIESAKADQEKLRSRELYVSAKVVAKEYNVSTWTVYRLAKSGTIPSHKVGGSRRFLLSELAAASKS